MTETDSGIRHPNRSGISLSALNVPLNVNAVWLENARPPSAPPRSPNPSSVNEARALSVATSASVTLAVRNPLAPPASSYPVTRSSLNHTFTVSSTAAPPCALRTPSTTVRTSWMLGWPRTVIRAPGAAPSGSKIEYRASRSAPAWSRSSLARLSSESTMFIGFRSTRSPPTRTFVCHRLSERAQLNGCSMGHDGNSAAGSPPGPTSRSGSNGYSGCSNS